MIDHIHLSSILSYFQKEREKTLSRYRKPIGQLFMSFHGGPKHRKNKTFVKTEEYFKKGVQSTPTTSLEMRWKRGIGKIIEMVALSITQKGTLSYLIL